MTARRSPTAIASYYSNPFGRLLKEIMPEGAGADALEVHALLLHHAYQFWGRRATGLSDQRRDLASGRPRTAHPTELPRPAQYLQLPELRVWGAPNEGSPPEPLDGMFVTAAAAGGGAIDVLAIFGMRPTDRASARWDSRAARTLTIGGRRNRNRGGTRRRQRTLCSEAGRRTAAGLYSVANAGELLLLTCRLLTLLDSG